MHLPQLPQQPLPTPALLLAAELNQKLLGINDQTKKSPTSLALMPECCRNSSVGLQTG